MKLYYNFVIVILAICVFTNAYAVQKNLNIAMVLWRGETPAEKGFKQGMADLGYKVNYNIFNAEQKADNLAGFLKKENKFNRFDYVYSFGTTVTRFISHALSDTKTPLIFNIVTDPVGAGIAKTWESSGRNLSGVSNSVSVKLQIQNAQKVIKFKKLGVFTNPREKNSTLAKDEVITIGEKKGFEVIVIRCPPDGNFLEENLTKVKNKTIDIDAAMFVSDSFLLSNAELIGKKVREWDIVSIGSVKKYIKNGVMVGTVTDYKGLGKMAAKIIDHHQHGEKLSGIPIQTQKKPLLFINKTTMNLLKVKIDAALMKKAIIVE